MKRKQLKGINDNVNVELMNDCLVNLGAIPDLADSDQSALDLLTHYAPDVILINLSIQHIQISGRRLVDLANSVIEANRTEVKTTDPERANQ